MKGSPTKTLLLAPLPLWAVIAGSKILSVLGVYWSVHGNVAWLALALFAALLFVVLAEVYAICRSVYLWCTHPASRTAANYVIFALAFAQLAVLAWAYIWWGQQPANPHL